MRLLCFAKVTQDVVLVLHCVHRAGVFLWDKLRLEICTDRENGRRKVKNFVRNSTVVWR